MGSRIMSVFAGLAVILLGGQVTVATASTSAAARDARPVACGRAKPGWSSGVVPPASAKAAHRFRLSDCYPVQAPPEPAAAWERIDPKTRPEAFLWAVLDYFYEGNLRASVEDSFDPALNPVRSWYNAPWLDVGGNGREGAHGLTRERTACLGELHVRQTRIWDTYAVGFYNAKGAEVLRRVWAGEPPDTRGVTMPYGTVGAKLLFTTADAREAPYLKGSPTWKAFIYEDVNNPRAISDPQARRRMLPVRLLQLDIAVRDRRLDSGVGWVFGTFVYGGGGRDGRQTSGWRNLTPLGLMWGNDLKSGEQWINPKLKGQHHLGWQGRLNGPVDNPNSSCLSCHASAQQPLGAIAPKDEADASRWFGNVRAGDAFTPGATPLDYSLQLAFGVENYRWTKAGTNEFQPPNFCPPWRPAGRPTPMNGPRNAANGG